MAMPYKGQAGGGRFMSIDRRMGRIYRKPVDYPVYTPVHTYSGSLLLSQRCHLNGGFMRVQVSHDIIKCSYLRAGERRAAGAQRPGAVNPAGNPRRLGPHVG